MNVSEIRENLMVRARSEGGQANAQGEHIGTVDHLDKGNMIKLNRRDSRDGKHHWIPVEWVESVDDKAVYLKKSKLEIMRGWKSEAPMH